MAADEATSVSLSDSASVGDSQVKLQILDYQGLERLIASHRGKVVVVDVWSTACPPCIKEFPGLVRLQQKYGPDRLACISLSLDYEGVGSPRDVEPDVLRFLQRQHATFDNVLASLESDQMLKRLGIYSMPAVFVYDRSGELAKRFDMSSGEEFTYQDVEPLVARLLAAAENGDSMRVRNQRGFANMRAGKSGAAWSVFRQYRPVFRPRMSRINAKDVGTFSQPIIH